MFKLRLIWVFVCLFLSNGGFGQNNPANTDVLFIVAPDHANWVYKTGEKAKVSVSVYRYGIVQEGLDIRYETGPEMLPTTHRGMVTTRKGVAEIDLGMAKEPGFRQCILSVEIGGQRFRHRIKLAWSPEKIKPTVALPADFSAFWQKAKAEAAKVPVDAVVTPLPEKSTPEVEVFLVRLQCFKPGSYVYGYLTKPRGDGKYPALFCPPGAGIKAIEPGLQFARAGFMAFEMEIHGINPMLDSKSYKEISNAFGDYVVMGVDDPDTYYYKKVYLGCVRALDFLCSHPEFDGRHVVTFGGSQGGALAIVTAALDNRVNFLVANYPALCDMTGYLHGRAGGWPHLFVKYQAMDKPDKIKTIGYYDVVNFARQLKVPGLYSWGYNDNTCPPTSVYAAYNSVTAPKEALITPVNEHWSSAATKAYELEWLKGKIKLEE